MRDQKKIPIKTLVTQLVTEHHRPGQLAAATFLGTMIGTSPFFGFHLLLAVFAGMVFKLNKVLIYAIANISNPFFAPFIIFASYQLGSWILTGNFQIISIEQLSESTPQVFGYWLLGSVVLGVSSGAVMSTVVFLLANNFIKRPSEEKIFLSKIDILAEAFRSFGRFAEGYTRGKLKRDPVYARLLQRINNDSSVLDLGGGQGLLSLMLALHAPKGGERIVVDYDKRKIDQGRTVAKTLNLDLQYIQADVLDIDLTGKLFDVVYLIDVLHYFSFDKQDALLQKISEHLRPGGTLYIRDMDGSQKSRTWTNRLQEKFSLFFGITKADAIIPREVNTLRVILANLGFTVSVEPCSGSFLYSNVLLTAVLAGKNSIA